MTVQLNLFAQPTADELGGCGCGGGAAHVAA
jgi:hypothetical protein